MLRLIDKDVLRVLVIGVYGHSYIEINYYKLGLFVFNCGENKRTFGSNSTIPKLDKFTWFYKKRK